MKYILTHEESCDMIYVQTDPASIGIIANERNWIYILQSYPDETQVFKYRVYAKNEAGEEYTTLVYASQGNAGQVFDLYYPNDTFIGCVQVEF